jgi:hypothetical protein
MAHSRWLGAQTEAARLGAPAGNDTHHEGDSAMQRKRLVLAVLATTVVALMLGADASATAATLPEFTIETNLTASFGESKLNTSGAEIKATAGIFNGSEVESKRNTRFSIEWKGLTLGGKECHSTSPSDTEGLVLIPVTAHLVHTPGSKEYFLLLLVDSTTIACKFLATKIEFLEGSTIIGKITPGKTKTQTFNLEVNVIEGKQQFTNYENDAGESVTTELKLRVDGVAAKGTLESQAATITTEKETEMIN